MATWATTWVAENGTGGTEEVPEESPYWSLPVTIILSITMVIIMTVAICGNAMVIMVIAKHRGMRTRTNMFLCNLAIADMLTGVFLMPFSLITVIKGKWIFGERFCQFNGFTMPLFFVASIHTLMYISLHKYITINRPFTRCMTRRRIFMMIAAAWLWAFLSGYLTVHGLNSVLYKPYTTQCGPSYPRDLRTYLHPLYISLTCYLIPFVIMVFCYVRIFREMQEHSVRMEANSSLEKDMLFRQQRRITITLCVVLLVFVISWTPYVIYSFYVSAIKDKTKVPRNFNAISYWFGYMNSACNPVIYALRSKAFRDGYKDLWFCGSLTSVSEDGGADSLYAKLIHKLFPTEPSGHLSTMQRLHYFIQNSLRLKTPLLGNTSSATALSDTTPASRRVSATSIVNYLVRPVARKHSTNSLPESFRFGTSSLSRVYSSSQSSPYKKVSETQSGSRAAVYYPNTYWQAENGKFVDGDDFRSAEENHLIRNVRGKARGQVKHAKVRDPLLGKMVDLENGMEGGDGCYEDDNVFVVVADMEPHSSSPHSPNTPLIQITAPDLDHSNPVKEDLKARFLSSKSQSVIEGKRVSRDRNSEDEMSRSTSESCVRKVTSPGFLRSILNSLQRKARLPNRSRSTLSSSSERKSSYREESSDGFYSSGVHEPVSPQRKKLSLTVPNWRGYLRSHSENTRGRSQSDVCVGHMTEDIHKAVSDTIVEDKGHYEKHKVAGRRWWRRQKRRRKPSIAEPSSSQNDPEASVITISQTEEELARLQRTWSEKPRMTRYGSVEKLDTQGNRRSRSFTPSRKKRKKKKKSRRTSQKVKPSASGEEEEKSVQIETAAVSDFPQTNPQDVEDQCPALRRTWSDPTITFEMLEGKVSAKRNTKKWYRQKTLKRRAAKGNKTRLTDQTDSGALSDMCYAPDNKNVADFDKRFPKESRYHGSDGKVSPGHFKSTGALDRIYCPTDYKPKTYKKAFSDIHLDRVGESALSRWTYQGWYSEGKHPDKGTFI